MAKDTLVNPPVSASAQCPSSDRPSGPIFRRRFGRGQSSQCFRIDCFLLWHRLGAACWLGSIHRCSRWGDDSFRPNFSRFCTLAERLPSSELYFLGGRDRAVHDGDVSINKITAGWWDGPEGRTREEDVGGAEQSMVVLVGARFTSASSSLVCFH